jgi:hypothetical protein
MLKVGREVLRPVKASGMQNTQLAALAQDSHASSDARLRGLRCGQRVRNYMKTKGMVDPEAAADLTDVEDERAIGGERRTWGHGRAGNKESYNILSWNYDSVYTQISD